MKGSFRHGLALVLALGLSSSLVLGGQGARFGKYVVEANHLEGVIGGPWEFSKGVTVTGPEVTLTCDSLKVWPPTKGGLDLERAEASGHLAVRGRYVASDGREWKIMGAASRGWYDAKAGQGVLAGAVKFTGVNETTKAVVSVTADKMTYDLKSRQFRFDRGGEPVLVEWEEPGPAAGGPPQQDTPK